MNRPLRLLLAGAISLAPIAACAQNYVVKDANAATQTMGSISVGGVNYPAHTLVDSGAVNITDPSTHSVKTILQGSLPAFAATPTVNIGTIPSVTFTNSSIGLSGTLPAFASTPTFNCGSGCSGGPVTNAGTTSTTAAAVQGVTGGVALPVSGTFWQTTQPVSIATMPTTPVTGTFWQSTQPVSVASLPLPTGAATAANQPAINADLGAQTHVMNFPATQAVSAAANSFADGSNVTIGTKADSAWAGTGSGSLIAINKAIYSAATNPIPDCASSCGNIGGVMFSPPKSSSFALTKTACSALCSGLSLKASAGYLYNVYVTTGSTQGWLMVFDYNGSVTPPTGSGSTVTPAECVYAPANSTVGISYAGEPPDTYSTGIYAAFSSTGCFTLTYSATAYIKGGAY